MRPVIASSLRSLTVVKQGLSLPVRLRLLQRPWLAPLVRLLEQPLRASGWVPLAPCSRLMERWLGRPWLRPTALATSPEAWMPRFVAPCAATQCAATLALETGGFSLTPGAAPQMPAGRIFAAELSSSG